MDKIILVIISSMQCVKCIISGADSDPSAEKQEFINGRKFDTDFFVELLKTKKVIIRKITLSNTIGVIENIVSITNYKLTEEENLEIHKYEKVENNKAKKNGENIGMSFSLIVKKFVPKSLPGYVLFFPSFIVSKEEEWIKACGNTSPFMKVWSLGCFHSKIGDHWIVNREKEDKVRQMDPVPIIHDILKDPSLLDKIPEDPSTEKEEDSYTKLFTDKNTIRGEIRSNDGNNPFSNGLSYCYFPSDFIRLNKFK